MSSFQHIVERDARLIILKALAERDNATLNTTALDAALQAFGIFETRDWIFEQLAWLEAKGAVLVAAAGTIRVATLTDAGLDHIQRRRLIDGIGRPSLASVGVAMIAADLKSKIGE